MTRETLDVMTSSTNSDLTSGNACWETPPAIFAELSKDFGPFDIDLCADASRHLCPVWFGPDSPVNVIDATSENQAWSNFGQHGFANPPYGPFVPRILAVAERMSYAGFTSTLLLPMRVTRAFREHVLHGAAELYFCDHRLTFWENGGPRLNAKTGRPDTAPFDSIIVRFVPGHVGGVRVGEWQLPRKVRT